MNMNSNVIDSSTGNNAANEAFLAQFKLDTGWNYSDAVDEAATIQRENRVFGTRRNGQVRVKETADQKFQRETGWSFGDAMDMAAETQREHRIFGRRHLN